MSKTVKPLLAALLFALLAAGCGPINAGQDTLKPPGVRVYRPPQVWVTHVPTDVSAGPAYAETTTPEPLAAQSTSMPLMSDEEFEQYMLDNIDALFDRIERKLDSTDVNP